MLIDWHVIEVVEALFTTRMTLSEDKPFALELDRLLLTAFRMNLDGKIVSRLQFGYTLHSST